MWTTQSEPSRKALVAWEKLCLPKSAGGLNIVQLTIWNKAVVSKMLLNLCNKKDKLWVR